MPVPYSYMEQVFYMYSIDILQVFYRAIVYTPFLTGVYFSYALHVFRFFRKSILKNRNTKT